MKKIEIKIEIVVLVVLTILLWGVIGAKLMRKTLDNTIETKKIAGAVEKKVVVVKKEIGDVRKDVRAVKIAINGINSKLDTIIASSTTIPVLMSSMTSNSIAPAAITTLAAITTPKEGKKFYLDPPSGYRIEKVVILGKDATGKKFKEKLPATISLPSGLTMVKYKMYLTTGETTAGEIPILMDIAGNITFIGGER